MRRRKRCAHGLCNSDSLYADKPHMLGVTFHSFPTQLKDPEKRALWVKSCNRIDVDFSTAKNLYICSKHFIEPVGPTDRHPIPIMATAEGGSCRTRRKLRDPSGTIPFSLETAMPSGFTVTASKDIPGAYEELRANASFVQKDESSTLYCGGKAFTVISLDSLVKNNITSPSVNSEEASNTTSDDSRIMTHTTADGSEVPPASLPFHYRKDLVVYPVNVQPRNQKRTLTTLQIYNSIVSSRIPTDWTPSYIQNELLFVKIQNYNIVMSLILSPELNLSVNVLGEDLQPSHPAFNSIHANQVTSLLQIFNVLESLNQWKICLGNRNFPDLFSECKTLKDCKHVWQTRSLHSEMCSLLVSPREGQQVVCKYCRMLKYRLQAAAKRRDSRESSDRFKPRCSLRYLPMKEIQRRFRQNKMSLRCSKRKIERLKNMIHRIASKTDDGGKTDDGDTDVSLDINVDNDINVDMDLSGVDESFDEEIELDVISDCDALEQSV